MKIGKNISVVNDGKRGYRVMWLERGKQRWKSYKTEVGAVNFAEKLKEKMAGVTPPDESELTSAHGDPLSPIYWAQMLARQTELLLRDPSDQDQRSLVRALAQAATAAKGHLKSADMENRLKKLEERQRAILEGSKHGVGSGAQAPRFGVPIRSGEQTC